MQLRFFVFVFVFVFVLSSPSGLMRSAFSFSLSHGGEVLVEMNPAHELMFVPFVPPKGLSKDEFRLVAQTLEPWQEPHPSDLDLGHHL